MIYDSFIFFNELDLLEIRLNVLSPYVDRFVLVEATKTHQGKEKPLHYQENRERFKEFNDRIITYTLRDLDTSGSWEAEYHQRNTLLFALDTNGCQPEDTVMLSDVDEIPRPEAIMENLDHPSGCCLLNQLYYYYLNVENDGWCNWMGTRILKRHQIDTMQEVRWHDFPNDKVDNAGWHWSFTGGTEAVKEKIRAYSHADYNRDEYMNGIEGKISDLKDIFDREQQYRRVEIDDSFPEYLQKNQEKYSHLILR